MQHKSFSLMRPQYWTWYHGHFTHWWALRQAPAGNSPGTPTGVWFQLPGAFQGEIIELSRLEKTFKIMKSDYQHGTTTKSCLQVPHLHIFWTLLGMVTPSFPWAACSSAWQPFPWNYYFPKYPIWTWCNLRRFSISSFTSQGRYTLTE